MSEIASLRGQAWVGDAALFAPVDLTLDSEGWTCLLGPSGVGKSTMQAMVYASVALLIANFILTMILNSIFPMGFMR